MVGQHHGQLHRHSHPVTSRDHFLNNTGGMGVRAFKSIQVDYLSLHTEQIQVKAQFLSYSNYEPERIINEGYKPER
jgi:hypothetical protein